MAKSPAPHVQANVTLDTIGYQLDLFVNGKPSGSICRDFGGDWPIKEMQIAVACVLIQAMEKAEAAAKRIRSRNKRRKRREVCNG